MLVELYSVDAGGPAMDGGGGGNCEYVGEETHSCRLRW